MKKNLLFLIVATTIICQTSIAQKEPKVLFIGLDGTRSDALQQASTPTIDSLMANGIYSYDSWSPSVTVSGPSWSNMLTGVWTAKHKVTNNSYSGADYANWPYLPNRLKEVRPDIKAVQILTWNPMDDAVKGTGGQIYNAMWDLSIDVGNQGQDLVPQAAEIQLQDPELDFLFAYIQDNDGAGHGTGFTTDSPTYMNSIEHSDELVKRLIKAVENRPTYGQEEWLILCSTDHGGLGFGHGGNSDQERHIWWFASAPFLNKIKLEGSDPGSFQMSDNPIDFNKLVAVPVQTDIAVTAIDHLLPSLNADEVKSRWFLDGQSWLKPDYYDSTLYENQKGGITVGMNDLLTNELGWDLYPNPVSDLFTINKGDNQLFVSSIELYSLNGALVKTISQDVNGQLITVDISDVESGTYVLSVIAENKKYQAQIVKK